jgi:hypothetical protein
MNMLSRVVLLVLSLVLLMPDVASAERKTRWLGGGIIGGSVGLATGLITDLIVYKVDSACGIFSSCNTVSTGAYIGIPVGLAVAGAGAGALIGMAFKRKNVDQAVLVAPMVDPATGAKGLMVHGEF